VRLVGVNISGERERGKMKNSGELNYESTEPFYIVHVNMMTVNPEHLVNGMTAGGSMVLKMYHKDFKKFVSDSLKFRYEENVPL